MSDGVLHLTRTHPIVEGLASYVMDAALDPLLEGVARRCGVIRTQAVHQRTTLLLLRLRYHIQAQKARGGKEHLDAPLLAEDTQIVGFTGAPSAAKWLTGDQAEGLLDAQPGANITPQQASAFVRQVVEGFEHLRQPLNEIATQRGQELLDAHRRVRHASRARGLRYDVRPHLPSDVLGVYVLLPAGT